MLYRRWPMAWARRWPIRAQTDRSEEVVVTISPLVWNLDPRDRETCLRGAPPGPDSVIETDDPGAVGAAIEVVPSPLSAALL
jgi:hypothetical protein